MKYVMLILAGLNVGFFLASLQPACGVNPWKTAAYATIAVLWAVGLWMRRTL